MILFGETPPAAEQIAQLAMAGDSVTLTLPPMHPAPPAAASQIVATAPAIYNPAAAQPWLAIDIETANGRPEEVERHLRLHWSPASNYKSPEAIGNAYLRQKEEREKKRALLDSSPIVVVSIQTPAGLHALHCLRAEPPATHAPTGGVTQGFATAREMLLALRNGLDAMAAPETCLVGHNIQFFDLPRLRWAYLRAGLRMPWVLADKNQPVFDSMRQFGRMFSQVDKPFIALADVLEEFGLPNHKAEMDGARVPEMVAEIQAGKWELLPELLAYALQDARVEADVYLRMTNQLPDQLGA